MLIGDVWGECPYVSTDGKEKSASARFKHLKTLQEHLARRWESEYVTQLRQFNNHKGATVHEGDVVLVVNDKKKRADWKLVLSTKFSKEETIEFESQKLRLVVQLLFVRYTTSCRWRFHRFVFSHNLLEVINV